MNRKLWAIVRREYVERVRTKAFVIGTVLGPLLMAAMMLGPMLLAKRSGAQLRVAVVDATGALQGAAEQALRDARSDDKARFQVLPGGEGTAEEREAALRRETLSGRMDGYVVLPSDAVQKGVASYVGRNVSNRMDLRTMERSLGDLLLSQRLRGAGLDPAHVKRLTRDLDLKTIRLSDKGQREDRGSAMMLSMILMMILYISILMWGQAVMMGVIEEKGSRVIEVLASGVPATVLLAGKLAGIGAAGFTQFLVWTVSTFVLSAGASGMSVGAFEMPEVPLTVLVSFVVFFALGFLFYAALYAAVGAAVNTVQEAQNFIFPVMLPLIGGFVCFPVVLESPDSTLAVVLSLIPPLSPLLMFLRIVVLTPPAWQIALSFVLVSLAIAAVLWFSARVYRVGILMYGKKPTFPELMKWVRHT